MSRQASDIRRQFIEFFEKRCGHTAVPSSPVVPHDDPTLLFTNAGMNQFKDVFLGTGSRPYSRAVDTQKCIRAGGKHNDLDDVGRDTYHHTFFEMLGNWSFGDYFKKEAIQWAWQLLTEVWGLDKSRLYATVFAGDEKDGLPADTEAEQLWKEVTDIDPAHVSRWGRKDNFWEMGDTGPCGPCTEIHYDLTPDGSGGPLVNKGTEGVIEIWNLVFIQFNRGEDGKLSPLPAKHVDTGMGFERLCRVLQGRSSNYDIDLWTPIFMAIEQRSGARAYRGRLDDPVDTAYRVIADHIRCLTFAITDGAVPGNDGRGYVLRRILRRAARFARQTLGVQGPLLHHLVPAVVEAMGDAFPELHKNPRHVAGIILDEEESFGRTLDRGLELFADALYRAQSAGRKAIAAEDAFRLHDTYGFPIDLTEQMALERGMTVDLDGYNRLMEQARETARAGATRGKAGAQIALTGDAIARLKHMGVEPTIDVDKFHGRSISARVKAIWNGTDFDNHTHAAGSPEFLGIITNRTNFYAEMGGQVGDVGRIFNNGGGEFEVVDTQAFGGYVLHIGRATRGRISLNDTVELDVMSSHRAAVRANHTATHLLNLALRQTLNADADQKGSLVAPDRLRFDFSSPGAVSVEQIAAATARVKEAIERNLEVFALPAPLEEAKKINGLRAVFGERYPDPVRVVSIGVPVDQLLDGPGEAKWRDHSIEFCGGTHVASTKEIGDFAIISEEAVAKGVRRITAITGPAASAACATAAQIDAAIRELRDLPAERLPVEVSALVERLNDAVMPYAERARLRGEIEPWLEKVKEIRKQAARADQHAIIDQAKQIAAAAGEEPIIVAEIAGANAETLRSAADVVRSQRPRSAMLLASAIPEEGKVAIIAVVPEALIKRGLKAGDWVREVAVVCGGKGGGRPDMAQAGGREPDKLHDALERARGFADGVLSASR
ncbi:MAG: alanine--tRNA ligase [Phycisphaerales bacterium]|nr:alanine--tRNA ligase [Phycisphaerales bacterium]